MKKYRYRIEQIKVDAHEGTAGIPGAIRKKIRKNPEIEDIKIIKESVDARRKPDVRLVFTVDFTCSEKLRLPEPVYRDYKPPVFNGNETGTRPVIAGFGPCGIFAALILAEAGLKPVVIERGEEVDNRVRTVERFWETGKLDTESNVQFGEGGAGTFSDGKLTTGIKDIRKGFVMKMLAEASGDEKLIYKQHPHIGTDRLRETVKTLRKRIQELGGEVRFNTRLETIDVEQDGCGKPVLRGITVEPGKEYIETDCLILAIGHSARDTFEMLLDNRIEMEQKPFSIGVRIEHPQEMINAVQYGDTELAKLLGPAEYKLNYRCENGRGVYTFCMCPGGTVIDSSSENETAVTNGMSVSARDGKYANSGLLVDVKTADYPSEHPLAGFEFQKKYEKLAYENGGGRLPKTDYGSFRSGGKDPVRKSLPEFASEAIIEAMPHLGRKLKGFDRDDAVLTAVETRSSSPVRILRDENLQTCISGIFPAGEGPGYAGGIVSAAVDGIRAAEKVIEHMNSETM